MRRFPRPRTLRARLTAAAATAILLAIGLLGFSVALVLSSQLRSSLDRALHDRAVEVARLSASAPALLTAPGALDAPLGGRLLAVEVVDRQNRILARSAALGGRLLPGGPLLDRALRSGATGYVSARLSGEKIRLYVAPVADAGGAAGGGAVLVASTSSEIDGTLRRVRELVALGALIAALLGALGAAMLTRRGLRPLGRLSAGARAIEETGDASRRLPPAASEDEVGELTGTLNGMLGALERARQTERRFLADASHELRTPLTSLRGNAAFVARHGPDPEALADLEADAARLAALLDDLLALEREEVAPEPVEEVLLAELVAAAARAEDVEAELCEPSALVVRGERGALERALANLVENARVHGPRGGEIRVELAAQGDEALLSVTDGGPGIPAERVEAAFGRFWRGPEASGRPGSGLGLAIVRATAERHGGAVEIEGARVTLRLPLLKQLSRSSPTVVADPQRRTPIP